jgi:HK97 family phage major capsid protein
MSKEKTLKELRTQMEALEAEVRAENGSAVEIREVEENQEEMEMRGVEQFIKGNTFAPEVRAMTAVSGSAGAITVPVNLSNQIIEKLVEQAALFGRAKSFAPVSGNLEILRESNINSATFIGEMPSQAEQDALKSDFSFDKVVLEQRRAATAIELSQQLVNDSGINVIEYATGVMTRRLAREMDKSVLTGVKTNKQFEGILTVNTTTFPAILPVAPVAANAVDAVLLDALLDLTLSINPEYLDGAVFVVGRPMFNKIAKLKDANGQYHLVKDVVNGKPAYRLFGHEVLIQENMPALATGAITVAFVNFGVAYATMIKRGAQFKRISDDTTQALRGSHLLMLDIYADGKIINENAIRFLKQA